MAEVEVSEVLLRLGAAVWMFVACFVLFRGLFILRSLRPRAVWLYVFGVAVATAIWRGVVLVASSPTALPQGFYPVFQEWVQPLNQVAYAMNALSLILLALVGQRRRGDDG